MRIFVFCFFTCMFSFVFSQDKCRAVQKKLKKVEKKILLGENIRAMQLLSDIESLCQDPIFMTSIGDIYFLLDNLSKSYDFYFRSYKSNKLLHMNHMSVINFLKSSYLTGHYDIFNQVVNDDSFNLNIADNDVLKDLVENNYFAFNSKQDSVEFSPVPLSINSSNDEYFPSMPINSDIIIYTYRDRNTELQDEDFYISRKLNNQWTKSVKLGDNINSDYREGALSVSLDGTDVFFASCHRPDSYGGCDLYYSQLITDTLWSPSYNMGSVVNSKYWESQPSISADGNLLFFTSNRHGGYGGTDIWMSKKYNNIWLSPVNMGPKINTSSDEGTPFLHYDNQTFYFSSKGHKGFGGFDLYAAHFDSLGVISDVSNLGYPINTYNDESGLIVSKDGATAYYSSDINQNLDIYSFQLPNTVQSNAVAIFNGVVIDSISRSGLKANIEIMINQSSGDQSYNIFSDESGFFLCALPLYAEFTLSVLCNGYDFFSSNYTLQKGEYNKDVIIVLNRLNIGNKINLDNIYYEFDDYSLKNESLTEIEKFAKYLILNSNLKIEIGGHTDNIGSESYNQVLSTKRAKSVYNALLNFGVSSHQITYKGYGYSMPLEEDNSEEARLKNRRTEIKVIGSYE